MEKPKVEEQVISVPLHKRKLPPWNGYGTFEDSAQNCVTVEPKQIFRDVKKFLKYDRYLIYFLYNVPPKIGTK